jgi:hypothetical protein
MNSNILIEDVEFQSDVKIDLPAGVYICSLQAGSNVSIQKIVKIVN